MPTNEGIRRKGGPPGKRNDVGNTSNPIAARKAGAARRDRRHVRRAVTMCVQLQSRANTAARGEVLELLGQAAQNAAIPTRPAARNTPASRVIPNGLPNISLTPLPPPNK
jgi:hypothetical protein